MNRRDDDYTALDDLFGSAEEPDPRSADVPPEYADAWRRGYERARKEAGLSGEREPTSPRPAAQEPGPERTVALDRQALVWPAPERTSHEPSPPGPQPEPEPQDDRSRRRPPAVVGLAVLALLLVVAAFGAGRLFAEDAPDAQQSGGAADSAGTADGGEGEEQEPAYEGPVSDVQVAGSTASCQAPSSVDAGGNPTSYPPAHAHDGDSSTAWRCNGRGTGQRLTITLPQETTVAEVGLVPGYAKTDPVNGADRYAENNRITRVRWTFDDGASYVQRMSGAPDDRSMRTRRIPETTTGSVVLEVLASTKGSRNTVAVSEVRIAQPAG